MSIGLKAFELARIQFAFTISFQISFPASSIGLACFLALLEWNDGIRKTQFTKIYLNNGSKLLL